MNAEFGAARRQEAQKILQLLMRTVHTKPYHGVFQVAGMPIFIANAGNQAAQRFLSDGICAACAAWGAEVLRGAGEEAAAMEEAPAEVVVIAANMPLTADRYGQESQMSSACAEIVRVLLAGAIIAAKDDCTEGDKVIAIFEEPPTYTNEISVADGDLTVLLRTSVKVIRKKAPERSYLLGNEIGGDKEHKLAWAIPLVDLFYGPKRLRWLDMRSPGHIEQEQMLKVAAS